jgi:glutamate-1-semialdehyde 2,1-aminomutase
MTISQKKIWQNATKIIPGGNSLLTKRPERFLPDGWPTYFSKSKGIKVWDLNNKLYLDMSLMGVGTSVLGYANQEVDKKIIRRINSGIISTLNSLDEYKLAKELIKIDKFADQVKFAKGGGEALSIAIRIARSSNSKKVIAFSGYHGWHDWYLSANLSDKKNLNNHLFKNLKPIGIPKQLKNLSVSFDFNDFDKLYKLSKVHNLAAVVIEPARFNYLSRSFVIKINNFCKKENICLIVDEITTGWREGLGGIYKKIGLKPDIVVYGKALGNGYAISAIVGKKKYMDKAQDTFISSVAWTEAIGFTAALAVINEFKKNKVEKKILTLGNFVRKSWKEIAKKNNIRLSISEVVSFPSFNFVYDSKTNEYLYTLLTELMLERGYLSSNIFFISYAHNKKEIKKYLEILSQAFHKISLSLIEKKKILKSRVRIYNYTRIQNEKK